VRLVVITGGEPFRQNLSPFIALLLGFTFEVQIETNGTLYQDLPFDQITVVCSPKTGSINKRLAPHIDALKYVVDANVVEKDGLPGKALGNGESLLARPPEGFIGKLYLQPYDSGDADENLEHQQAAIRSTFKTGGIYCHQLHKLIGLE
jgi:organic radical activating enzyme